MKTHDDHAVAAGASADLDRWQRGPGHLTPRVPDDVPASIDATVRGELGLVVLRRRGLGWVAAPFGVGCHRELPLLPGGLPPDGAVGCDASGTTS